MNLAQGILVLFVRAYQRAVSPVLTVLFGPLAGCRFEPTCSQYALDAVKTHGALRGSWLSIRRLCRCHPWGGCGHDPVPPRHAPVSDFTNAVPATASTSLLPARFTAANRP